MYKEVDSTLIIDDDSAVHVALEEHLGDVVTRIIHASTPEAGLRKALTERPSLILLDINMPRMDGLKVCRLLKESESTRDIPVLFLTVDQNVQHLAKALECGGSDYIRKPFNPVELLARVRAALRTKQMIDLLRDQARIDGLTGIRNRAALDEALVAAVSLFDRSGQPLCVLMLDIDHFKAVNDGSGHGVGDEVLRSVGGLIQRSCRPSDAACRFGGDEFGVVLVDTDEKGGMLVAERLLESIRELRVTTESGPLSITASAGLAPSGRQSGTFASADILKAADDALYQAKSAGRNCLVLADEPARSA
jgi:two-component system cell cycle response regulator